MTRTVRTLLAAEAVARKGATPTHTTAGAANDNVGNGSAAADEIMHERNVQGFEIVERLRGQHPQQCQDAQNAPPPVSVQPPNASAGAWPPTPSRCPGTLGVILLSTMCHSDPGDRAPSLPLWQVLSWRLARRGVDGDGNSSDRDGVFCVDLGPGRGPEPGCQSDLAV